MAYAQTTFDSTRNGTGFRAFIRSTLAAVAKGRKRDRAYRKTYRELDQMSDRDLADIGITRFMIADVAAEAAARV